MASYGVLGGNLPSFQLPQGLPQPGLGGTSSSLDGMLSEVTAWRDARMAEIGEMVESAEAAKREMQYDLIESSKPGSVVVREGESITVNIGQSDSGYDNKIYYTTDNWQTRHLIGTDNGTGTVTLPPLPEGTEVQFGIENGNGEFFKSGSQTANPDGLQHVRKTDTETGFTLGFEDLHGGGDNDFNDAVIHVTRTGGTAAR